MRSTKTTKTLPDIPLDIQIAIVSKLPVKKIAACKCLSKAFNKLISDPFFTHMYRANNTNSSSLRTIFVNSSDTITFSNRYKPNQIFYLHIAEFKRENFYNNLPYITKHKCSMSGRLPIDNIPIQGFKLPTNYSICCYCNGLICLLLKHASYKTFIANPITGEYIELPDPATYNARTKSIRIAYGLGYCQFTDRYKVLRIITEHLGGIDYETKSEILTIGFDKKWRSVKDVPYTMTPRNLFSPNRYPYMVALGSAIHWLVQPIMSEASIIKPKLGGTRFICAFDLKDERVHAKFPFPRQATHGYGLAVLSDKLCFWESGERPAGVILWVMDKYGVEDSWIKRSVLRLSRLPPRTNFNTLTPLAMSVEDGVILVSDHDKLIIYDIKANKTLKFVYLMREANHAIPIVPDFVSFKNRQGWIPGSPRLKKILLDKAGYQD